MTVQRFYRLALPHLTTFFSFGAIQGAQILLPLLALPHLARVLGPDAFGLLLYMMVLSMAAGLVADWGFTLGAAREAAVCRKNKAALADLLGAVITAKCLLILGCALAGLCLFPLAPHAQAHPYGYGAAIVCGCVKALNPTWFFQGKGEGMQGMALWDIGSSALILALTVLCIRQPAHWPLYLILTALCKGGCYLLLTARLVRDYAPRRQLRAGWAALRRYGALFGGVIAGLFYYHASQMLLGHFLLPAQMGILLAADKIVRAAVSVSTPISQTVFPEVCALRYQDPEGARRVLRWSLLGTLALMLLGTALIWGTAPRLIALALGPGYEEAVLVLRIMVFLVPVLACNYVLGVQTLVPFGCEKALLCTQAVMAILSLPLAATLARTWGLWGAAWFSLLIESGILLGYAYSIRRFHPLFRTKTQSAQEAS